jgi:hypothetical protein
MYTQTLSDGEIQHDLFGTSRNGIGTDVTVQTLDLASLATSRVGQTTEDLGGLTGTELERGGRLGLERGDGTAKLEGSLELVEVGGLVNQLLHPCGRSLDLADHVCELETDDRVVDQSLAKGLTLVGVLDGLLVADTGEADALANDTHALVVEVGHDDLEALVDLAENVLDRDLDVLECDVGRSGGPDTLAVHAAGGDTWTALDEQNSDAVHSRSSIARSDSGCEVICPDSVGDPLLLTVDNVVLAILGQLGLALECGDIGTTIGLGHSKTDTLVTRENLVGDLGGKGILTEDQDWRGGDTETSDDVPDETSTAGSAELVNDDLLVETVPVLGVDRGNRVLGETLLVKHAHETGKITALAHHLVDLWRDHLGLFPFVAEWLDVLVNKGTDLVSESDVGLVVVRGWHALVPWWIGIWDHVTPWLVLVWLLSFDLDILGSLDNLGSGVVLLWLGVERADLQLALVLVEDGLVVVFPELGGSVLSSNSGQNCCGSFALAGCRAPTDWTCQRKGMVRTLFTSGMLILELGKIVNVVVDNDE